jgi:UDP-N-acetylglucosamine 2-epimerase (non-hydrolysing)
MVKILHILGARPNFMKAAPVISELKKLRKFNQILIHTGQHFDEEMSDVFFLQLKIPKPKHKLSLESKTAASQIGEIITKLEKILTKEKPKLVIVYGDVNSTVAAAITSNKLGIKLCHIESGLRSLDKTMPEEINRIITDKLADLHFVTENSAIKNLKKENIPESSIFFVGNTMIDSLEIFLKKGPPPTLVLPEEKYCLTTFHRPSNVDTKKDLKKIINILNWTSKNINIVFPVHPRTLNNLEKFNLSGSLQKNSKILLKPPSSYTEFLFLTKEASFVITDSGGIQEECSHLNTPCLTLRKNTERPITISQGSNILVDSIDEIRNMYIDIKNGTFKKSKNIKFWDGKASQRIAKIIYEKLS